jgi:hypothetical protein
MPSFTTDASSCAGPSPSRQLCPVRTSYTAASTVPDRPARYWSTADENGSARAEFTACVPPGDDPADVPFPDGPVGDDPADEPPEDDDVEPVAEVADPDDAPDRPTPAALTRPEAPPDPHAASETTTATPETAATASVRRLPAASDVTAPPPPTICPVAERSPKSIETPG